MIFVKDLTSSLKSVTSRLYKYIVKHLVPNMCVMVNIYCVFYQKNKYFVYVINVNKNGCQYTI